MAEEEGKQEMTDEILSQSQSQSQSQDEGCQADDELEELETDFFGLNDINKEDNMKVKLLFSPRSRSC